MAEFFKMILDELRSLCSSSCGNASHSKYDFSSCGLIETRRRWEASASMAVGMISVIVAELR